MSRVKYLVRYPWCCQVSRQLVGQLDLTGGDGLYGVLRRGDFVQWKWHHFLFPKLPSYGYLIEGKCWENPGNLQRVLVQIKLSGVFHDPRLLPHFYLLPTQRSLVRCLSSPIHNRQGKGATDDIVSCPAKTCILCLRNVVVDEAKQTETAIAVLAAKAGWNGKEQVAKERTNQSSES